MSPGKVLKVVGVSALAMGGFAGLADNKASGAERRRDGKPSSATGGRGSGAGA